MVYFSIIKYRLEKISPSEKIEEKTMPKKITYDISLKAIRPDLMKEWDTQTNASLGLFPEAVSPFSHKKASWICPFCEKTWFATINSRSQGTACPHCKGNKISKSKRMAKQENSLAELFPDIALEWHPTKNGMVTPQNVNYGSRTKYWWKCKYGHEWQATVCNRTGLHTNCPKCSEEMHTSFPEQAIYYFFSRHFNCQNRASIQKHEIDIFIPEKSIGIEYDGRYFHKRDDVIKEKKKDDFFNKIGIRIIRIKEDDFNAVEPNCIHYIYSPSNYFHLDWAISELLKVFEIDEIIDVAANQVAIMAQYVKAIKENSIREKYPELAKEWDVESNNGITPDMVSSGSHKKVFWRCEKGHIFRAAVNQRVRYYNQGVNWGCQYCSGHKVLRGYNDLQTTNPQLAEEWDLAKNAGITPCDITTGCSNKKYWWKCQQCGKSYQATVKNRCQGRGCPTCKPIKIAKQLIENAAKEKSFADAFPELVCEWDSSNTIKPTEVASHSNIRIKWMCSQCGHGWITTVNNRANGTGCRECYNKNRKIWNKRAIICIETKEAFESISEASRKMSISNSGIKNCLNGSAKSAGGFHWQYF